MPTSRERPVWSSSVGLGAVLWVAACGARSATLDDEALPLTGCAAETARLVEACRTTCGVVQSPLLRGGKSRSRVAATSSDGGSACVDACIGQTQQRCEESATCECPLATTTQTGGGGPP